VAAKHICPDPQKFAKSKKKSQQKKREDISFSPLYGVFDLSNQMEEVIVRPNENKTDGGYVNDEVEKSTWL